MLFNYKNYQNMDFEHFIKAIDEEELDYKRTLNGYEVVEGESVLYGEYEYSGGNTCVFPGELFRDWEDEQGGCSTGYVGEIDAWGHVELHPDYVGGVKTHHYIYRRDLTSLKDEVNRYAEYCVRYIWGMESYMERLLNDGKGSGKKVDPMVKKILNAIHDVDDDDLIKSPSLAIHQKTIIESMYVSRFGDDFWFSMNDKKIEYPFISSVVAPGEEKYIKDKKLIKEREKVHFSFLNSIVDKAEIAYGKHPAKSAAFIIALIFMGLFIFATGLGCLIGFASAINQHLNIPEMVLKVGGYFALSMAPLLLIGLILFFIRLGKINKYKKYRKELAPYNS